MRSQYVLLALLLVLGGSVAAAAQETTTGSIGGRVVDAQNLPVPGATVTIVSPQGDRTFTTDSDGRFLAPFLTPGAYEIKVELQGFRPLDRKGIQLQVGQRIELPLGMTVGALTETVQVTGETPVIDTSTTTTGATTGIKTIAPTMIAATMIAAITIAATSTAIATTTVGTATVITTAITTATAFAVDVGKGPDASARPCPTLHILKSGARCFHSLNPGRSTPTKTPEALCF